MTSGLGRARGVAWLELEATRTGVLPQDPERSPRCTRRTSPAARALEAEGRRAGPYVPLRMGRAGPPRPDRHARRPSGRRSSSAAPPKSGRPSRRRAAATSATGPRSRSVPKVPRAFAARPSAGRPGRGDLSIPASQRAASADSPEERLSAELIPANLRAQTSFYPPELFLAATDAAHAFLALVDAAEIDPDYSSSTTTSPAPAARGASRARHQGASSRGRKGIPALRAPRYFYPPLRVGAWRSGVPEMARRGPRKRLCGAALSARSRTHGGLSRVSSRR